MAGRVDRRLAGLQRFAVAITVLNVLGHAWLGFEQAWLHPLAALAAAYATELLLEAIEARAAGRPPRFRGGPGRWVSFLLPAHITGLAVAMLLYANDRPGPIVFAAVVAIASKYLLRLPVGGGRRHVFNPSNLGITSVLLLLPWVGIAQPYMFTENLYGAADWLLPAVIVCTGTLLNARFTGRLPLIASWLAFFWLQGAVRSLALGLPLVASWVPMTGVAFLLFTFYMVTDPATTPATPRAQVAFGAAVALAYSLLMTAHVVFGLFFALTAVCTGRALGLMLRHLALNRPRGGVALPAIALEKSR